MKVQQNIGKVMRVEQNIGKVIKMSKVGRVTKVWESKSKFEESASEGFFCVCGFFEVFF